MIRYSYPNLKKNDKMTEAQTDYKLLTQQVEALLGDETDATARASNFASFLFHELVDLNWCGFYWLDNEGETLVVGAFQGRPACLRIPMGKGVCGTAASRRETLVVPNVHGFPGHIACDCASNSEGVVPIIDGEGALLGVLDIDSPKFARFDEEDARGLERLVEVLMGQ